MDLHGVALAEITGTDTALSVVQHYTHKHRQAGSFTPGGTSLQALLCEKDEIICGAHHGGME